MKVSRLQFTKHSLKECKWISLKTSKAKDQIYRKSIAVIQPFKDDFESKQTIFEMDLSKLINSLVIVQSMRKKYKRSMSN